MKKRKIKPIKLNFDRIFGDNHELLRQIVWICVLIAFLISIIGGVGYFCSKGKSVITGRSVFIQSVGLAFGASNLPPGEEQTFPILWQAAAYLLGAIFFSGVIITWVGNWLNNRQESYRNGTARYKFNNHVLFLGGGKLVDQMLTKGFGKKDVVVLTSGDVASIRLRINRPDITILYGHRDNRATLESVFAERASEIYIVGEDPYDEEYDTRNIACWNIVRDLCKDRKKDRKKDRNKIPCYLMLEHTLSAQIFYLSDILTDPGLDTVLINNQEVVAQKILVHNRDAQNQIPTLDRDGIGPDDCRTVHLVLYGMTSFSQAFAITAAHICHFPNFIKDSSRRTRITMIAPNIERGASLFMSKYSQLFSMSKVIINGHVKTPGEDFLDVEWEFVDGHIDDEKIRRLLSNYYDENRDGKTYLSIAMCLHDTQGNIESAMFHLPEEFHEISQDGEDNIDYTKTIPIFVYQHENEELAQLLKRTLFRYQNIIPVGGVNEDYLGFHNQRIEECKRFAFLTHDACFLDSTPKLLSAWVVTPELLDEAWKEIAKNSRDMLSQLSTIYFVNHIGVKLRSLDYGTNYDKEEAEVKLMAEVEHNRWNVASLLMGYEALPKSERNKQHTKDGLSELRDKKKKQLKHFCIAPYSELRDCDKAFDRWSIGVMGQVVEDDIWPS